VNICIIVQARMTSTRLPGKILLPVMGRPLLSYQIERLVRSRETNCLVIATTTNETDDPVVKLCDDLGTLTIRGSELDVLDRYHQAAERIGADAIVRITSDCPLIDPAVIDESVRYFLRTGVDWMAPEGLPDGMGMDVFSRGCLEKMWLEATDEADREHVTLYAIRRPHMFNLGHTYRADDLSAKRWTIDEQPDYEFLVKVIEYLYPKTPNFGIDDVLWALSGHPEWEQINANVVGKFTDRSVVLS
jgi:spore coat polysaccharide biosynthesis protein SpsF